MEIFRSGSRATARAPEDAFTGTVWIDPVINAEAPARVASSTVTFEPGARTGWHTHPLGQTLIVTAGCGWVQREGSDVVKIHPGDVVWIAPGEKHWHGATAATAMTHLTIQEALEGKTAERLGLVSDAEYPAQ
jgi:quercetin dioxygenase-like cupin family protein